MASITALLRAKCSPLAFIICVVIKLGGEGDGQARDGEVDSAFVKRVLNRFGESLAFEGEGARQNLQVVKILHAGIGDAEFRERFELFGNGRFLRIGQQARAGEFEERGVVGLGRCGRDGVAESDVDLDGNLLAFEIRDQGHEVVRHSNTRNRSGGDCLLTGTADGLSH